MMKLFKRRTSGEDKTASATSTTAVASEIIVISAPTSPLVVAGPHGTRSPSPCSPAAAAAAAIPSAANASQRLGPMSTAMSIPKSPSYPCTFSHTPPTSPPEVFTSSSSSLPPAMLMLSSSPPATTTSPTLHTTATASCAVIGVGRIGSKIAADLCLNGASVVVWDKTVQNPLNIVQQEVKSSSTSTPPPSIMLSEKDRVTDAFHEAAHFSVLALLDNVKVRAQIATLGAFHCPNEHSAILVCLAPGTTEQVCASLDAILELVPYTVKERLIGLLVTDPLMGPSAQYLLYPSQYTSKQGLDLVVAKLKAIKKRHQVIQKPTQTHPNQQPTLKQQPVQQQTTQQQQPPPQASPPPPTPQQEDEGDTFEEVVKRLEKLGIQRYAEKFREADVTGRSFAILTESDLREMGIPIGPRRLILDSQHQKQQQHQSNSPFKQSNETTTEQTTEETTTAATEVSLETQVMLKGVVKTQKLGQGNFGSVCKGLWNDYTSVAMKTMRSTSNNNTATHRNDVMKEAQILSKLRHPSILQYYGLSQQGDDLFMVMELADGCVVDLIRHSQSPISNEMLLQMAQSCAAGMSYLSGLNIIHRDLACRNLLYFKEGSGYVIKVADFGLARTLDNKTGSADLKKGELFPWKWTSLEAIEASLFTVMSDVWSFGVVLWELFSRGAVPYEGISNDSLVSFLKEGNRLAKPWNCNESLYALMLRCWHDDPLCRPSFLDICKLLHGEQVNNNKRLRGTNNSNNQLIMSPLTATVLSSLSSTNSSALTQTVDEYGRSSQSSSRILLSQSKQQTRTTETPQITTTVPLLTQTLAITPTQPSLLQPQTHILMSAPIPQRLTPSSSLNN